MKHLHISQEMMSMIAGRMLNVIYPVGSIYISTVSTNPGTLFGGSWSRIEDTFLLASGQIYNPGDTGGEAEHTLTVNEMPSHTHTQYVTANSGTRGIRKDYQQDGQFELYPQCDTGPTGGDQPHNNMPPYLAVYVWKRIA